MATEVLVMCPACGRPQPPGEKCVQCGAPLPSAPEAPSTRAAPPNVAVTLPAAEPSEVDFGGGLRLRLTADVLELEGGPHPQRVELATLARAQIVEGRVRLFFIGILLGVLMAIFVSSVPAKVAVGVLAAWQIFMYLRSREYGLELKQKSGSTEVFRLGQGGRPVGERIRHGWAPLAAQLRARGIDAP